MESVRWWRPACHKPDLLSGFVNFTRIGKTLCTNVVGIKGRKRGEIAGEGREERRRRSREVGGKDKFKELHEL